MAAEEYRDLRSLAPAAAQHADPADVRDHGHLGAPCAARRRPRRREEGPVADGHSGRVVHLRAGLRIRPRRLRLQRQYLRRHLLHGDRFPWRACADRHDLPDRLPGAGLRRAVHAQAASRLRIRRLVLAFRRRGVDLPVRLHLRVGPRSPGSGCRAGISLLDTIPRKRRLRPPFSLVALSRDWRSVSAMRGGIARAVPTRGKR